MISTALAIKNKPNVCLVFFYKIRADNDAPIRPPSINAYL